MDKIALVTGGSRGIGRSIAVQLAKDGYDIWLNYSKSETEAEEVKAMIESLNRRCDLLRFSVSSKSDIHDVLKRKLSEVNHEKERLVALVNNAGIVRDNLFNWLSEENWEEVINTNLNSFFYITKMVVEEMLLHRHGYIVNMSSVAGEYGSLGQVNYSASKGGIIAATKSLAKELARMNINVNCVTPGIIETDMTKKLCENKSILKQIPLNRFGKAEEVAHVVSFLCSPRASYIVGAIIPVNGGMV